MSFNPRGLDNRQLVWIYYKNLEFVDCTDNLIDTGMMMSRKGPFIFMQALTEENITQLRNNGLYLLSKSIVDVLKPIVEIILSSEDHADIIEHYNQVKQDVQKQRA